MPGSGKSPLILIPLTPFSMGHIRAYGLSIAAMPSLLANSGPASEDALLLGMITSVSGNLRHITDKTLTKNLRIVNKRFKNRIKHLKIVKILIS